MDTAAATVNNMMSGPGMSRSFAYASPETAKVGSHCSLISSEHNFQCSKLETTCVCRHF